MEALELFAILVLAGAIVVLLYYYMEEIRQVSLRKMRTEMIEMGEKIKGKVRGVPVSTDVLSGKIEHFLEEKSDQLIRDWELATQSDISRLDERIDKVFRDVDELGSRFNEFRTYTNKKIDSIEKRLEKLEIPKEGEEE